MVFKAALLTLFTLSLHSAPGYFEPWGRDASLIRHTEEHALPKRTTNPLGKAAEETILFHQNYISPLHGGRSNFRPTSSRYMFLAIRRYGFLKGYIMGCDRLMRENKDPWVYRTRKINNKLYKWDPTF